MKSLFLWVFLFLITTVLSSVVQDGFLFEYVFLLEQCQNGKFTPYEYVNNTSFGDLLIRSSGSCPPSNGVRFNNTQNSVAVASERSISSFLNHIQVTKTFSIEFWQKFDESSFFEDINVFGFGPAILDSNYCAYSLKYSSSIETGYINVRNTRNRCIPMLYSYSEDSRHLNHIVITFNETRINSHFEIIINGQQMSLTNFINDQYLSSWTSNHIFTIGNLNIPETTIQSTYGDLYLFRFYDRVLNDIDILHNKNEYLPLSKPVTYNSSFSLQEDTIFQFPFLKVTYDFNDYAPPGHFHNLEQNITLLSLPFKGFLLINTANITYEDLPYTFPRESNGTFIPIENDNDEYFIYASISLFMCDYYYCSENGRIDFYVTPVNDPPIPLNPSFSGEYQQYNRHEFKGYDIENDPITSLILYSLSENCLFYTLQEGVYIPQSIGVNITTVILYFRYDGLLDKKDEYISIVHTCEFSFSLLDDKGAISTPTNGYFYVLNPLSVSSFPSILSVKQDISLSFHITQQSVWNDSSVTFTLLSPPRHGSLTIFSSSSSSSLSSSSSSSSSSSLSSSSFTPVTTLLYTPSPYYFNSPLTSNMSKEDEEYIVIQAISHDVLSPPTAIPITVINTIDPIQLICPESVYIPYQNHTLLPPITLIDHDQDTQTLLGTIRTLSGVFRLYPYNSTHDLSLSIIAGFYDGMTEDVSFSARGMATHWNELYSNITYKLYYTQNDTLKIYIENSKYNASCVIFIYTDASQVTYTDAMTLLYVFYGVCLIIMICCLCSTCYCVYTTLCCCCKRKKQKHNNKKNEVLIDMNNLTNKSSSSSNKQSKDKKMKDISTSDSKHNQNKQKNEEMTDKYMDNSPSHDMDVRIKNDGNNTKQGNKKEIEMISLEENHVSHVTSSSSSSRYNNTAMNENFTNDIIPTVLYSDTDSDVPPPPPPRMLSSSSSYISNNSSIQNQINNLSSYIPNNPAIQNQINNSSSYIPNNPAIQSQINNSSSYIPNNPAIQNQIEFSSPLFLGIPEKKKKKHHHKSIHSETMNLSGITTSLPLHNTIISQENHSNKPLSLMEEIQLKTKKRQESSIMNSSVIPTTISTSIQSTSLPTTRIDNSSLFPMNTNKIISKHKHHHHH
ncbi:hypothetical protein WA158_001728 [Blastocystis sp. Blastoise]